jgi:hypothetical protein
MTAEEFRKRASDCLRWAQEAANERTKALWLSMAQIWLDRAERARRSAASASSANEAFESSHVPNEAVRQSQA